VQIVVDKKTRATSRLGAPVRAVSDRSFRECVARERSLPKRRQLQICLWALVLLPLLGIAPASFARTVSAGALEGTVTDTSGARIPEVKVTATLQGSPAPYEAITDESGRYRIEHMAPGDYDVSFSHPGFKGLRVQTVPVRSGGLLRLDGTLDIGSSTMTVTLSIKAAKFKRVGGDIPTTVILPQSNNAPTTAIAEASPASRQPQSPPDENPDKAGTGKAVSTSSRDLDQLQQLTTQLQQSPGDQALREKIINLARTMSPPPALPEEAARRTARGIAVYKEAKSVSDYKEAVAEFDKAIMAAPWYADAYYNLGLARAKAEEYAGASVNLRLYLLAAPGAKDAAEVKTLIYEMELKQEKADKERSAASTGSKDTGELGRGVSVAGARVAPQMPYGSYYALVIGINNYHYLPTLRTALKDADAIAAVLRDRYGFHVRILPDATRYQILSALDEYRRTLSGEANLLIYYAGHGYYDPETEKAYWLPIDAEKDNHANWIIADDITSDARAMPALHVLIVSDSCYSGSLTREANMAMNPRERESYLQKMLQSKSRNLMSSGGNEPVADGGGGSHSVFANAILQGLNGMEVDVFTAMDLFDRFIQPQVAGRSNQVPQYSLIRNSGHENGDFVFSRLQIH
jgi:uncharacterized caspase-like protein